MELSEDMKEALRILREDKIIENTARAREDNAALLKRLEERDAADTERWGKWQASQAERVVEAPKTPENDPEPVVGVPPAPPPAPETERKAKKRGIWFPGEDDKEGE
jgi:hypothetical protein